MASSLAPRSSRSDSATRLALTNRSAVAEEPEPAGRLQARREERRRQEDHRDLQRVLAQPLPAVVDDAEHQHRLGDERRPGQPVEDDRDVPQVTAPGGLLDRQDGDDQQRRDQQRPLQARLRRAPRESSAAGRPE